MSYRFFHRARVNVAVDVAWDIFTNHERLGDFTASSCRIITAGSPERNGLGCVRGLGFDEDGLSDIQEVVNYWQPNKLFGYHVIASPTVTHHQGIVRFFPLGENKCEWVHDLRFVASDALLEQVPNFQELALGEFDGYMQDVEAECERRSAYAGVEVPLELPPISVRAGQLNG